MSEKIYIIKRQGNDDLIYKESEIIQNALDQEKQGIKPHYAWYDSKNQKAATPAGWLVWSTYDGCGVVFRRTDGKMIIQTGMQGDFCHC